jgi:hypothetical protein
VDNPRKQRWRIRLEKELAHRFEFDSLGEQAWIDLLRRRRVTSSNHDTVVALDWPHYCTHATTLCGGTNGWCYTFQGHQAGANHNRRTAMVDSLARHFPKLFADAVAREVSGLVANGKLPYANLRYSGSGELAIEHLPALTEVASREIHLWGFTRNLKIASGLLDIGASVIISCDASTPPELFERATALGFPFAYTSSSVSDLPPPGTIVTFPVHRVGRVTEVPDVDSLCPKVLSEFFFETRSGATCQSACHRCHDPERPSK